jgi:hypothetical protein
MPILPNLDLVLKLALFRVHRSIGQRVRHAKVAHLKAVSEARKRIDHETQ